MWLQIIGVVASTIGFFTGAYWLVILGGAICILLDIVMLWSGQLKPIMPFTLYIGGYIMAGGWVGVLYGSIVANALEVLTMAVIAVAIFVSNNQANKPESSKQNERSNKFSSSELELVGLRTDEIIDDIYDLEDMYSEVSTTSKSSFMTNSHKGQIMAKDVHKKINQLKKDYPSCNFSTLDKRYKDALDNISK